MNKRIVGIKRKSKSIKRKSIKDGMDKPVSVDPKKSDESVSVGGKRKHVSVVESVNKKPKLEEPKLEDIFSELSVEGKSVSVGRKRKHENAVKSVNKKSDESVSVGGEKKYESAVESVNKKPKLEEELSVEGKHESVDESTTIKNDSLSRKAQIIAQIKVESENYNNIEKNINDLKEEINKMKNEGKKTDTIDKKEDKKTLLRMTNKEIEDKKDLLLKSNYILSKLRQSLGNIEDDISDEDLDDEIDEILQRNLK